MTQWGGAHSRWAQLTGGQRDAPGCVLAALVADGPDGTLHGGSRSGKPALAAIGAKLLFPCGDIWKNTSPSPASSPPPESLCSSQRGSSPGAACRLSLWTFSKMSLYLNQSPVWSPSVLPLLRFCILSEDLAPPSRKLPSTTLALPDFFPLLISQVATVRVILLLIKPMPAMGYRELSSLSLLGLNFSGLGLLLLTRHRPLPAVMGLTLHRFSPLPPFPTGSCCLHVADGLQIPALWLMSHLSHCSSLYLLSTSTWNPFSMLLPKSLFYPQI